MPTVGDVKVTNNCKRAICLMTAQNAANNPPTLATDGVPNFPSGLSEPSDVGAGFRGLSAEDSTLLIRSVGGSGTLAGTFTLWGYLAASGAWYPMKVNGGVALAEVTAPADLIAHREVFNQLGHFDRLYLELASPGGTTPNFEAYLVTARQGT